MLCCTDYIAEFLNSKKVKMKRACLFSDVWFHYEKCDQNDMQQMNEILVKQFILSVKRQRCQTQIDAFVPSCIHWIYQLK